MIYNDAQFAIIKKASPHYETARHDYVRNAPTWLTQEIINVYEAATGKTILHKTINCAVCVLRIYQTIGQTYFKDLAERQSLKTDFKDLAERNKSKITVNEDDTYKESTIYEQGPGTEKSDNGHNAKGSRHNRASKSRMGKA